MNFKELVILATTLCYSMCHPGTMSRTLPSELPPRPDVLNCSAAHIRANSTICDVVEFPLKMHHDWIVTLFVFFFVLLVGMLFAFWYYRKRKGHELCTSCQCCWLSVFIILIYVFCVLYVFRNIKK